MRITLLELIRQDGRAPVVISTDLGLTTVEVKLDGEGMSFRAVRNSPRKASKRWLPLRTLAYGPRQVVTIELDPTVLQIAQLNPWSRALLESPGIDQIVGDSLEGMEHFESGLFTRITHDPSQALPGSCTSWHSVDKRFVCKPNGRTYHYIANPRSRSDASVTSGAVRRRKEAGFRRTLVRAQAFGVTAYK